MAIIHDYFVLALLQPTHSVYGDYVDCAVSKVLCLKKGIASLLMVLCGIPFKYYSIIM